MGTSSGAMTSERTLGTVFRKVLKTLWVLVCALIVIALPFVSYDMIKSGYKTLTIAWFIAFVFVALSLPITLYEVTQHLENYRAPRLQRHVIRILWMVPIYAVDGWFALRFISTRCGRFTKRTSFITFTRTASCICRSFVHRACRTSCSGSRLNRTFGRFPYSCDLLEWVRTF